jgi:hypothetical protein
MKQNANHMPAILIVDCDQDDCQLFKEALAGTGGYLRRAEESGHILPDEGSFCPEGRLNSGLVAKPLPGTPGGSSL